MVIRDTPSFNEKPILIKPQPHSSFITSSQFFSSFHPTWRGDKNADITQFSVLETKDQPASSYPRAQHLGSCSVDWTDFWFLNMPETDIRLLFLRDGFSAFTLNGLRRR